MQIQTGKQKRSGIVDLNLVPFIDLMSVCIIFLLITAVWTQVSMIQLGSSIYSNKTADQPVPPTPFMEVILKVDVTGAGFRVFVGKDSHFFPMKNKNYDQKGLIKLLQKVKQDFPRKIDGFVSIRDEIPYKHLVEVMDSYIIAGFPQISITTTGVQ